MKQIVLIHGYNGVPEIFDWLKKELTNQDFQVILLDFPAQKGVIYQDWANQLKKQKIQFDEQTIVIAHSIGNAFWLKYMTENQLKIGMYISLAGFGEVFETQGKEDLNRAIKNFAITTKQIEQVKKATIKKYSIYSDNDHIVPFSILQKYPHLIVAEPLLIKGIGHMGKKSGLKEIPKVVEIITNSHDETK